MFAEEVHDEFKHLCTDLKQALKTLWEGWRYVLQMSDGVHC
jgi:sRNA-binding protein